MGSVLSLLRNGLAKGSAQPEPLQDTLIGEAYCSCSGVDGQCSVRLRGTAVFMKLLQGKVQEDVIDVVGFRVEYSGTTVSLSCDSTDHLRMTFDVDMIAFRWATKLAVAAGDMESIAELFAIQHQKIDELERHSEEAQSNNEQIERCLNFLSKEYVDISHEARTARAAAQGTLLAGDPKKMQEADLTEAKDITKLPPAEFSLGMRQTSEPEREP
eukprot:TRINITY_DN43496_c0_g1_i1.p1 TRINITY_DN43496_c0_g1~~TRINITY_DN43496_c0_g1_i1.p1  ORF type:complete len:241 (+),score=42.46 TRINITY_DN43496_c0_g1_i1:83-724(+)